MPSSFPKGQMLQVEVVTRFIGSMIHCPHCQIFLDQVGVGQRVHEENLNAYPPEWQAEWERLSHLVERIAERFAGRITIHLTDAQSLRGLWWALRGVRRYPTFIIEGQRLTTWEEDQIATFIRRHLNAAPQR